MDGNLEKDPWTKIESYLKAGFNVFGCTVMPGPQLKQAIPFSKKVKELFPDVINIWGGYFASNQYKSVINSGFVDFIVNGPGDYTFPQLLHALASKASLHEIQNLIFKHDDQIVKTPQAPLGDQDKLPDTLKNNKANNKLYMLPFILGILGLVFQIKKPGYRYTRLPKRRSVRCKKLLS